MATLLPTPTEPMITEDQNCISIEEARSSIKTKFMSYHQLLDERESELISELNQLEETNKPELTQVRHDLNQLEQVLKFSDETLGANTLKLFLLDQKNIMNDQILHFQRSEKLLSHVTLKFCEIENSVKNVINVVPFWSKAKFRNELEPYLDLKEQTGGDRYLVSKEWYSEFTNSINLESPQPNDNWEFPVKIPIETSTAGNIKMLHSKAWNMLLAFNGLSPGSIPTKGNSYLTNSTRPIQRSIDPIKHRCIIGHNDGSNKFSFECEIETFPNESYKDLIQKLSEFWKLFTEYTPILYAFDNTQTISCNSPKYTRYTITERSDSDGELISCEPLIDSWSRRPSKSRGRINRIKPIYDLEVPIRKTSNTFLILIPDKDGSTDFSVST